MIRALWWMVPVLAGLAALAAGMHVGRQRAAPPPPPVPATLTVRVAPAGASVYVDDVFHGVAAAGAPVTVAGLAPGRHVVRASAAGYVEGRTAVDLAGDPLAADLSLVPEPTGRLIVVTDPPGAHVAVDNLAAGITRAELTVSPGRHVVSLAYPNYNPETRIVEVPAFVARPAPAEGDAAAKDADAGAEKVEAVRVLEDGPDASALYVFVPLRSRQSEMFRQRLKDNPADVAAINDFWVHLFDLGEIDEAAAVAVEGLYQGETAKNLDNDARQGMNRLRNEIRGKQGRTGMPRWKDYLAALDRAIIAAVADGRTSPHILQEFRNRVKADAAPEAYLDALAALAMRDEGRGEIVTFIRYATAQGKTDRVLPYVDRWLEKKPSFLTECVNLLTNLKSLRDKAADPAQRAEITRRMDRVREVAQPLRVPGRDASWLWREAEIARDEGRVADWRRFAEGAIDAGGSLRSATNNRRVALAAELADDPAGRRKAARLVAYAININLTNDNSANQARALRDKLVEAGVAVNAEWPAALDVADWLVAGPFPVPAGDGPALDRAAFEPDRAAFARAQAFAAPGSEAKREWRRVEWEPGDPAPAARLAGRDAAAPDAPAADAAGGMEAHYARTWIYSSTPREVELTVAMAPAFRLYGLDMAVLAERPAPRADAPAGAPAPSAATEPEAPATAGGAEGAAAGNPTEGEAAEGAAAGGNPAEEKPDAAAPADPSGAVKATVSLRPGFTPLLLKWVVPAREAPAGFDVAARDPNGIPLATVRVSAARL